MSLGPPCIALILDMSRVPSSGRCTQKRVIPIYRGFLASFWTFGHNNVLNILPLSFCTSRSSSWAVRDPPPMFLPLCGYQKTETPTAQASWADTAQDRDCFTHLATFLPEILAPLSNKRFIWIKPRLGSVEGNSFPRNQHFCLIL